MVRPLWTRVRTGALSTGWSSDSSSASGDKGRSSPRIGTGVITLAEDTARAERDRSGPEAGGARALDHEGHPISMLPRVHVFGPVYLDRVLRVDGPLRSSGPIDRSVQGRVEVESPDEGGLEIVAEGGRLLIDPLPESWPGPRGQVLLDDTGLELDGDTSRKGVHWRDDLGGMGAGYAAALKGKLDFYMGDPWHWVSQQVKGLMEHYRVVGAPSYRF